MPINVILVGKKVESLHKSLPEKMKSYNNDIWVRFGLLQLIKKKEPKKKYPTRLQMQQLQCY